MPPMKKNRELSLSLSWLKSKYVLFLFSDASVGKRPVENISTSAKKSVKFGYSLQKGRGLYLW